MASSRATINIVLDDQSFAIRPLTLRQLEAIEICLGNGPYVGQAWRVVAAALERDHAAAAAVVENSECGMQDIKRAMTEILIHGGFLEGEAPGEIEAAAGNASGANSAAG